MPTATDTQQDAPQLEAPDLVSKVPTGLKKKREGDVVYSRSRRQKLGGVVTTVFLTKAGAFRVEGPNGEDWGEYPKFTGKHMALEVARNGPPAEEPEASGSEEEPEAETEGAEAEEATEEPQEVEAA
jgi:hypothetical protein